MDQLESKIETSRHNFKIQMDKDLNVLQKQINLHVHDIERIQGFVSTLAIQKGKTRDELIRGKERSRKTMEQLKKARQVGDAPGSSGQTSPTKKTGGATLMGTHGGTSNQAFVEGSPVEILLFGQKKSGTFSSSFGNTQSSDQNSTSAQIIQGLKHVIKVCNITTFAVSTTGSDGQNLYSYEVAKA